MLTLDQWAAIAEVIGAVGVIASLVYLAIQIRQNTDMVAANTFQAISSTSSNLVTNMFQTPELIDALLRVVNEPEEMSQREFLVLDLYFRALTRNFENYYYQHQKGFLDDEIWTGYVKALMEILHLDVGKEYWGRNKHLFGKSYVEFIDHQLLEGQYPAQSIAFIR
jgi:hypothetical protein